MEPPTGPPAVPVEFPRRSYMEAGPSRGEPPTSLAKLGELVRLRACPMTFQLHTQWHAQLHTFKMLVFSYPRFGLRCCRRRFCKIVVVTLKESGCFLRFFCRAATLKESGCFLENHFCT